MGEIEKKIEKLKKKILSVKKGLNLGSIGKLKKKQKKLQKLRGKKPDRIQKSTKIRNKIFFSKVFFQIIYVQNGCLHFKVRHNKSFADFCQLHHSSLYSSSRANVLSSLKKRKTICSNCHETTFFCKRVTTVLQKLLTNFRPFGPLTASKHYIPILCSFCHLSNSSNFPTFFYFVFFHGISSRDIIEGFFKGYSKGFLHGIFPRDFSMGFF